MITRIVKMQFLPDSREEFLQVFNDSKEKIRNFPGCTHLELLNDQSDNCIFFTYSKWQSEAHLSNYRESELFISTWSKTKVLFSARAEAWTVNQLYPA